MLLIHHYFLLFSDYYRYKAFLQHLKFHYPNPGKFSIIIDIPFDSGINASVSLILQNRFCLAAGCNSSIVIRSSFIAFFIT